MCFCTCVCGFLLDSVWAYSMSCIQPVNKFTALKIIIRLHFESYILLIFQKVKVDETAGSERQSMDVCAQDIWLDKAEVCLSMGLYQPARQLLAEAHLVAMVS